MSEVSKLAAVANGLVENVNTSTSDLDVLSLWVGGTSGGGATQLTKTILNSLISSAASAMTSVTGDVTGTGPGATAVTISNGVVTLTKMANLAANSIIGNNTGSSSTPLALTEAQVTAMLNAFTSSLQGVVPASGGGSVNFLRADGTWATPPSSGGTVTTVSVVSANGLAGTVANATTTPAITLSTSITGVLKGNGTAISAATAGTDYVIPSGSITGTASNITASSNSTLTTLSALSLPYSQVTGAPAAITALTGDATASGPGSAALTLATVNSNTGSFGSSTAIPNFTVNGKGLITAAGSSAVVAPAGTLTGTTLASNVVTSSLTALGSQSQSLDMNSNNVINLASPVNPNDAVNKSYVDNFINATSWKTAALVATTANITLSGEQTIDGVLTSSSRVLVKNQTLSQNNGLYTSGSGAWTRTSDMNSWSQVPAAAIFIESGSTNADLGWVCTSQPGGTLGTTAITFVQFSSAGAYMADGVTLQLIGGTFSIKNGGVTETQINNSALSASGALSGGSGTKLSVNVDNSTIDISSNNLEVKAAGITSTQLASASVTTAKLGTITDGVTLDQSGAGSTLEIKTAGVGTAQLASASVTAAKLGSVTDGITTDQSGSGSTIEVLQSPKVVKSMIAGQSFSANTSYLVRFGINANSETTDRVYSADSSAATTNLNFWGIGMASSTSAVSAGQSINVTLLGTFTLGSSDTNFVSGDIGHAVWLTTSGGWSTTAPSASGTASYKVGMVEDVNKVFVDGKQLTGIN